MKWLFPKTRARFVRWCHLMHHLGFFGPWDPHRGVQWTTSGAFWRRTISVECDCGRVFWRDEDAWKASVSKNL
jgi:hypothetical protein